jgi:hypothetical protein
MRAFLTWITGQTTVSTEQKAECAAFSLCEVETDGLIEYSQAHDASVIKEHALKRTQHELELLFRAIEVCPMSAFYLETADGRVLNQDDAEVQNAINAGTYRWS